MPAKLSSLILLILIPCCVYAQHGTISGKVKDETGHAIEQVTVAAEGTSIGTHTDAKGYYTLEVPAGKKLDIIYSFVGYQAKLKTVSLSAGQYENVDIILKTESKSLIGVEVKAAREKSDPFGIQLNTSKLKEIVTPVDPITAMIKTYVGSHNELTSQYSVRGGNYDENLVYVNDFEVYRPFLVRSGQQEGLSFVNSDLVSNVSFSVGGFQARYGDKMSSVLDVTYKTPTQFAGSVMLSMLGANLHLEGISKNKKLTYLVGVRQKSNQYILQAQPTKGVYNPSFTDIQALVDYKFNAKWDMEVIANYARNRFTFEPEDQTTSFGVLNQAYQLRVFYTGNEIDQFDSRFGGISTTYHPNDRLKLKFLVSGFQTNEQQTYDISGEYLFGELQTDLSKQNFGQIVAALGTGIIQDYTRDYLNINLGNAGFRGSYDAGNHFIQWGLDANITSINDNLHEWERRDSAGFTQPYGDTLKMAYYYNSSATFNYARYDGFIQDNFRFRDSLRITGSAGVRFNYSSLNNELIISPRLQLAYKPLWERDVVFKFATGLYAQPPFYREMRDFEGNVNTNLKAQKSYHTVLGADYNYKLYDRPFKVTAELYYKNLWDIDPYTYDNVSIRYTAKNDAVGYIYGGELRLYGDIVKDATSWISIGLMKAEQKLTDNSSFTGYFPLPSDQRFMLGMYFEDYLPRNKNFKMHLNVLYATGLPVGPPSLPIYDNSLRIPDYKRVDIGFSALLLDGTRRDHHAHSYFNNLKSIWASLEVFNLLDIQNTLSYTYIQDQTTNKIFAVPNRLTSRLLNLKVVVLF